MTALRGYGGLTFATACKVLIYEFSELYPDWATPRRAACVKLTGALPVPGVPAEGRRGIKNGIKMTQRSRLEGGREMRCRLQRRIGHIGFQIGSRGLYCNEN